MRPSKALPWLAVGYAVFGAVVIALAAADVEVLDFYRDPSELSSYLGDHPWKGSLSIISVFLWAAAATLFLLAGSVLRAWGERDDASAFFLSGGGVLLLLGLDDGLAIHETVASRVPGTDNADRLVQLLLGLLVLGWLVRFRRRIMTSNPVLLGLAGIGLATGTLLDARDRIGLDASWAGLFEESVEFAGLATLLVYAATESWHGLSPRRY